MPTEPVTEEFTARSPQGTVAATAPGNLARSPVNPAEGELGELPAGAIQFPAGAVQFDELLPQYQTYLRGQRGLSENTLRVYTADLESYRRYLVQEGLSLTDMDRPVLRGYLAWLATEAREATPARSPRRRAVSGKVPNKDGYARVSIVRKLTALRSFYRYLVQLGYFRHSPVPSGRTFQVKVEKPLPTFLGKQEVNRLLDAPKDDSLQGLRDRAILEILYSCGVRLAEIQELDLGAINFKQRQILVRGKGSKERWVLFGEPTEAALKRYLQEARPQLLASDTSAVFLNRYGDRLSRRSIEKLVRDHSARAGLREGIHPHTLRHTFASHMLEGDADLRVIQELLGHSSPTTTQIYTHVTKQEARKAYMDFHPRAG